MPRPKNEAAGGCKIRKRGCSSSSSSVLQNYRLKRAVLIGKRCGTTTPAPAWKVVEGSPCSSTVDVSEFSQHRHSHSANRGKQGPVSARKLANALWELNAMPSPLVSEYFQERRSKNEASRRSQTARFKLGSIPPYLSDPSHSPVSEVMDWSGSSGRQGRLKPLFSQKSRLSELNNRALDSLSIGSLMEVELRSQGLTVTRTNSARKAKSCLKKLTNNLHTSKELLKILGHVVGHEEHTSSSIPIVSVLSVELEKAHAQVDQLVEEQILDVGEINYLKRWFVEERASWERKEKERTQIAIRSIMEELKLEKKFRRKTERVSKKLYIELSDIKNSLSKANKELEKERRLRELIEHVCDDMVNGIGDNKVEVIEMKREAAKEREELEKEREMLQLADVWREERVQMKLSEAKFQLEEKNAAVDQLRNELEAFLASKRSRENSVGYRNHMDDVNAEELSTSLVSNMNADGLKGGEGGQDCAEDDGEVDSVDSDLHSIELNMDSNSESYKWNFTAGEMQQNAESTPVDEDNKGTNISQENTPMTNLLLDRSRSVGSQWNLFNRNFQDSGIASEIGEPEDNNNGNIAEKQIGKLNPDAERYKSVKGLRDKMLSSSKIKRGLSSPTRPSEQVYVGSKVSEMLRAMGNIVRTTGGKVGGHSFR